MKNHLKRIFAGFLAAGMALTLTACGDKPAAKQDEPSQTGQPADAAGDAGADGRTFAVVFPIVHPFFEPIGVDAEEYGAEKGWKVITKAPDSSNAQQQIEIVENLISMGVDGIAVGPTDPDALASTIDKALEAGIKVICFETDSPNSKRLAYIGTDNYNAGRHMGAVIEKNLGGKGNIMILTGLPTQMSLNERIRGIKEYLGEKCPDIQIIDTQTSEGDAQKAVTATENMIQAHSDFDAIIGIDATAGPAAVSVWKAMGWQNDPEHLIITFDDMPDNLQGMKDGYIKAIVAQRQTSWGVSVLDLLNDLCDGKTVQDYTDTGSIEITLDNIDTYPEEPSFVES